MGQKMAVRACPRAWPCSPNPVNGQWPLAGVQVPEEGICPMGWLSQANTSECLIIRTWASMRLSHDDSCLTNDDDCDAFPAMRWPHRSQGLMLEGGR